MAAKLLSSGGLQSSGSITGDFDFAGDSAFPLFGTTVFGLGPVSSAGTVTAGGTAGFEVTPGGLTPAPHPQWPSDVIFTPLSGVVILTMPDGYYGDLYHPTGSYREFILSGGIDGGMTVGGPDTVFFDRGGILSGATLAGGSLEIASGGTAGSSTIVFSGGGRLTLDDATTFGGAISGFDSSDDSIDLGNVDFSHATLDYSGNGLSGTLTVTDGTHSATINLLGDYTTGGFHLADDGHGGTLVTDQPEVVPFSTPGIRYLAGTNSGASGTYTFSVEEILNGGTDSGVTVAGHNRVRVDAGGSVGNVTLSGGTLDIKRDGTAGSSTITFTGAGGGLELEDASAFHGTVSGFNQAASIDLENIKFSDASFSYSGGWQNGTLTITDGAHSAALAMLGGDIAGGFGITDTGQFYHLADDGHGGTLLTEQIPPDAPLIRAVDGFGILNILFIQMPDVSSGQTLVVSAGQADGGGYWIDGGAEVIVLSGAVAGGYQVMGGTLDVFGTVNGVGLGAYGADGTEIVESGGLASGAVILRGAQYVLSGGHAIGTEVDNGGWTGAHGDQYVMNGGVADGTRVGANAEQIVYAGGVANATRLVGGLELIESGGIVNGATVSAGTLEIMSGGTTGSAAIVFAGGGQLKLDDATTFSGAISGFDNQESIDLANIAFSGAALSYTDNGLSGTLTVGDGTHLATLDLLGQYDIRNFRIADDGHGSILLTDRASQVMNGWDPVQNTGVITNDPAMVAYFSAHDPLMHWSVESEPLSRLGGLDDHGVFTSYLFGSSPFDIVPTVVSSGQTLVVSSSQTAGNYNVQSDGEMLVEAGGRASLIGVDSGGLLVDAGTVTDGWLGGHETVTSGGVVSQSRVDRGFLEVQSGGTASGILVDHGVLQLDSGGIANDVLLQGGTLEIMSGVQIWTTGWNAFHGVAFQGSGGSLKIDDARYAVATVAGFDASDTIDLANMAISSATLGYSGDASSGTLTVTDGAHTTWLAMIGNYAAANFHLADDGHGGTMVTGSSTASDAPPILVRSF